MTIIEPNSEYVFDIVRKVLPKNPIIIEAGAFDGWDTMKMINIFPEATIHAFEPDPDNYTKLLLNTADKLNIFTYQLALSNSTGKATFYQSNDPNKTGNSISGSLLKPKEHLNLSKMQFNSTVEVNTITINDWAKKNNITHADFLWFDMQGTELHALKAGLDILKTVKVIYTEVLFVEAYAGQYLYHDLRVWLEGHGFKLVAKDFEDSDKSRWFGNIIMVRDEQLSTSP